MSNTTTPTRTGRGAPVPGIDTTGTYDAKAHGHPFSGWPQTPQSAQDSRRPSLAFSSDGSGPPSLSGYSQPATPVHSMHHTADHFAQQWSNGADIHATVNDSMNNGCVLGHGQPMYNAALPQAHQQAFGFSDTVGLGQTLYQSSQAIGQNTSATASMYVSPSSSMHGHLDQSVFANYDTAVPMVPIYHPPQSIVPSQLSAHDDYTMQEYVGLEPDVKIALESGTSFDSGYGDSYEIVGPSSPDNAYFEDEDDFIRVKQELPGTTSQQAYIDFQRHPRLMNAACSPSRVDKRAARKQRKTANGKAWSEHRYGDTIVRCAGKRFDLQFDHDLRPTPVGLSARSEKPHRCNFKDDNGEICGRGFDRGEHLKRHAQSHSDERPFPCPVPFEMMGNPCKLGFSRSDNATDHLKTHLRPTGRGKRNKHCGWDVMEASILDTYCEKQAAKILGNLRKWYDNCAATNTWK